MGCGCGGGRTNANLSWKYTAPNGQETTFRTEIEAKAAVVRNNGGTYQAVPR